MKRKLIRMGKPITLLLVMLLCSMGLLAQQSIVVKGSVSDSSGAALAGSSVRAIKSGQVILSDSTGQFQLFVAGNEVLEFSRVGYTTSQLNVSKITPDENGVLSVQMTLYLENKALDEVIVVGFGNQKKKSMVSSVTAVNVEELRVPTGNITNALAGRVAGMISFQTSGEPGLGTDNSQFYIIAVTNAFPIFCISSYIIFSSRQ